MTVAVARSEARRVSRAEAPVDTWLWKPYFGCWRCVDCKWTYAFDMIDVEPQASRGGRSMCWKYGKVDVRRTAGEDAVTHAAGGGGCGT